MVNAIKTVAIGTAAIVLLMSGTALQMRAATTSSPSPIDVAEGDRLAHTLCINCHVVDIDGPLVRTDRVPSFTWVAQQPGSTRDSITVWLSTSHERMPDFTLTRAEIRQLTAYILSLRKQ